MVLRGSAQKGYTSDVDFFNGICESASFLGDSIREGIEVTDDDGNWCDAVGVEIFLVGGDGAGKDAYNLSVSRRKYL